MKLYQAIVQNAMLGERLERRPEADKIQQKVLTMAYEDRKKRIENALPHGSGFDAGVTIEKVTEDRIVFQTSFHHMDDNGFYDGWTNHRVTVRANLMFDFDIAVSGQNKRDIKDYIRDVFNNLMVEEFKWL